jgi:hypothetical protein
MRARALAQQKGQQRQREETGVFFSGRPRRQAVGAGGVRGGEGQEVRNARRWGAARAAPAAAAGPHLAQGKCGAQRGGGASGRAAETAPPPAAARRAEERAPRSRRSRGARSRGARSRGVKRYAALKRSPRRARGAGRAATPGPALLLRSARHRGR